MQSGFSMAMTVWLRLGHQPPRLQLPDVIRHVVHGWWPALGGIQRADVPLGGLDVRMAQVLPDTLQVHAAQVGVTGIRAAQIVRFHLTHPVTNGDGIGPDDVDNRSAANAPLPHPLVPFIEAPENRPVGDVSHRQPAIHVEQAPVQRTVGDQPLLQALALTHQQGQLVAHALAQIGHRQLA